MKIIKASILGMALIASPLSAQDDGGEYIVVTATKRSSSVSPVSAISIKPPVIGLKRQADSAVRDVEITSDSLNEGLRRKEVQAMLMSAIDRAKSGGLSLVTGQFELVEVTRANWQDQFPGLAGKVDPAEDEDDDDYDYDDDNSQPRAAYEDNGRDMTIRLKVKVKLDGSIGNAQQKIDAFVKAVPVSGRSLMNQKGGLALTIINPEQYRDEIYKRVATAAKHAAGFYEPEYGLEVSGLDDALAWSQVSNTEVFLYLPYDFIVRK